MRTNKLLWSTAVTSALILLLAGCTNAESEEEGQFSPPPTSGVNSESPGPVELNVSEADLAEISNLFVAQVNILTKEKDISPLQAINLESSGADIQAAVTQVVPNLSEVYLVTNEHNKSAFLNSLGFRITSYHFAEGVDKSGYTEGDIVIDGELVSTYEGVANSLSIPSHALTISGESQEEQGQPTVVTKVDNKWLINVDSQFSTYDEPEVVSLGSDALVAWTDFNK